MNQKQEAEKVIASYKNRVLPFGKYQGRRLSTCPDDYLKWAAGELKDTDFHIWAMAAVRLLEDRKEEQAKSSAACDTDADAFLRKHGLDPKAVAAGRHR